jgi:hypothetical protein
MINDYAEMLGQANALRAALEEKLANARESVRKRDERIADLEEQFRIEKFNTHAAMVRASDIITNLEAELLALREAKEEDDLNAKEEAIGYEL